MVVSFGSPVSALRRAITVSSVTTSLLAGLG
jgi:hypothetical protein